MFENIFKAKVDESKDTCIITESGLMSPRDAASYLGLSIYTLAAWRTTAKKNNLPFVRLGKRIKYKKDDLDKWLNQQIDI